MSTSVIIVIVAILALAGIGIVIDELFRLRKWLNKSPDRQAQEPPESDRSL